MAITAIDRRTVVAQPTMFVRYTTSMDALPARVGHGIDLAYAAVEAQGLTPAGHPYSRYLRMEGGTTTVEIGLPVTSAGVRAGDVEAGELPGGLVAHAVHDGAYEQLGDSYRAIERWASEQGTHFTGAPWEFYVVDPHATPDASAWRTEIHWPVES